MEDMPGMTLEEWTEFLHLKPGDKVKYYVRKEGASGYVNCTVVAPYKGWALLERNADYATVKGFGSAYRNATFFRTEEKKVKVVCGCFYGTLEEFRKKVKETHGESKIAKEYLMVADLMEYHFEEK